MDNKNITRDDANTLYSVGNNQGLGYAPYTDEAGDDTVATAVAAAEADGWTLLGGRLAYVTTDDVAVLVRDGECMAIGGDAMGCGARAVMISDVAGFEAAVQS